MELRVAFEKLGALSEVTNFFKYQHPFLTWMNLGLPRDHHYAFAIHIHLKIHNIRKILQIHWHLRVYYLYY